MKFARVVYLVAGIYGLIAVTPGFFMEGMTGRDHPPAVTHPEYYYGFFGVALAWQVAFLIIARDPLRYRPLMIACFIEKALFPIAVGVLYALGRVPPHLLALGGADVVLLVLFVTAWVKTAPTRVTSASP